MASKQWFMNLFFAIGVPMLILGIALFGVTLYMRRRATLRNRPTRGTVINTKEAYSHIDFDLKFPLNRIKQDDVYIRIGKNKRILKSKLYIIQGRESLKALSRDQVKFNKLIVKENIETHNIVNGKVV